MKTNKKNEVVVPVTGDGIYDEFLSTSGIAELYASKNKSRQPASGKSRQPVSGKSRQPTSSKNSELGLDKNEKPILKPKAASAQAAKRKTVKSQKEKQISKPVSDEASTPKETAGSFETLWQIAAASKAKKPKESQVWLDTDLYRKIEMFNVCRGKPVPTKHLINAILQLYLDEHKIEISKASK